MVVYRIQKAKYKKDISGFGSTLVSGRWNFAGDRPILYTASSQSLAILETLAHLTNGIRPPKLVLLKIYLPDEEVRKIEIDDLPSNWNKKGYFPEVQEWGTEWAKNMSSLAVSVPSVISSDPIILINPQHPGFYKVKVITSEENFLIDDRLL